MMPRCHPSISWPATGFIAGGIPDDAGSERPVQPSGRLTARRRLGVSEPWLEAESLAVSPNGLSLTVSFREQFFDLMLAEGVPGLERARRKP